MVWFWFVIIWRRTYFARYAETCFSAFGDRVKCWITLNEPLQVSYNGHGTGLHAPGRSSDRSWSPVGNSRTEPYIVAHNELLAHAAAVNIYNTKYKVCTYKSWELLRIIMTKPISWGGNIQSCPIYLHLFRFCGLFMKEGLQTLYVTLEQDACEWVSIISSGTRKMRMRERTSSHSG
mgnify:FL=1